MSIFTHSLVFESGPRTGRRLPFTPPQMTLGRASECDIAIGDPMLSRKHCRFEMRPDGHIWVIDLESANETLVNEAPVKEQRLDFGDTVTVGDSTIRIERADTPAPADEPHALTPAEVVIDLGFDKTDDDTAPKKNLLRPIIWSLAGILILFAGAYYILNAPSQSGPEPKNIQAPDNTLLIAFEKIEASAESIFRYEMTLTASGALAGKIDDLSGTGRHIEKKKDLSKNELDDLARDLEGSGFFDLDKSYTGYTLSANTLNECNLTIVIGKRIHTCRVTNRSDEPEPFRTAREKIETFSMNALGLWGVLLPVEELTRRAENALDVARKRYAERDVTFGNLYSALRNYKDAVFYLETVNPKPDFYGEILDGFDAAQKELEQRHNEYSFQADRAIKLSDWQAAARELKIIQELIPDRSDSRHMKAVQKLLDIERRSRQK